MKISRQKKINKILNFYSNNYHFHKPFQILIDGTYCFAALKNKHNIEEVLPKYFQSELKLLTTSCIILETEQLDSKLFGAMVIVKKFAVHKCNHIKKSVSGAECIKSMIGKNNKQRYIIATQDRELQQYLRNIPGVPLLYLHNKTPVLEQQSSISINATRDKTLIQLTNDEVQVLEELKEKNNYLHDADNCKSRKRKRKGGPNPLSCKKKKKINQTENSKSIKTNSKIKRKRIRIPKHVKEELFNNLKK